MLKHLNFVLNLPVVILLQSFKKKVFTFTSTVVSLLFGVSFGIVFLSKWNILRKALKPSWYFEALHKSP